MQKKKKIEINKLERPHWLQKITEYIFNHVHWLILAPCLHKLQHGS